MVILTILSIRISAQCLTLWYTELQLNVINFEVPSINFIQRAITNTAVTCSRVLLLNWQICKHKCQNYLVAANFSI